MSAARPWVLLVLVLVACPVATAVVGTTYDRDRPVLSEPPFNEPVPGAYRAVVGLTAAHAAACAAASLATLRLTRGRRRYLALAAIFVWLLLSLSLSFGAMMATTGVYL